MFSGVAGFDILVRYNPSSVTPSRKCKPVSIRIQWQPGKEDIVSYFKPPVCLRVYVGVMQIAHYYFKHANKLCTLAQEITQGNGW